MKELEQQRLTMTNVIIGLSVLSFSLTLGDLSKINLVNGVGLPVVVIFANLIIVLWNNRSRAFIKMHQKRAHAALKFFAPEIEAFDITISKPFNSDKDIFSRPALQTYLYIRLMSLAILPILLYFKIG